MLNNVTNTPNTTHATLVPLLASTGLRMGQPSAAAAHSFYALRTLHRTMTPARQRQLLAGLQRHSLQQVRYIFSA